MVKRKIITKIFILSIAFFSVASLAHAQGIIQELDSKENERYSTNIIETAEIFYNEACGMCATYVKEKIPVMLENVGIKKLIKYDYINEKENRVTMNNRMDSLKIPFDLQSHIMTFVGDKYVLAGHIPENIVYDVFENENNKKFKRIIIYQDIMHGEFENYRVLAIPYYADDYVGETQTYDKDIPITKYFEYLEENKDSLLSKNSNSSKNTKSILPVVLISGFLDGLNPCAFAVLLFFIAFLFSIKRSRKSIWQMGGVYILAIFLAYILIGFGILKAVMFSNAPHFMAKLGSWLIIVLGAVSIFNYYSAKKIPLKLGIPTASKETIHAWMYKATLPAAFVMGFLVGLCTFPCSGGIYVAIISLLVVKTTYWSGVAYLFVYNLMFVLPLVIVLAFTANKFTFLRFGEWQQKNKKRQKLFFGLSMIILGLIILIFFI